MGYMLIKCLHQWTAETEGKTSVMVNRKKTPRKTKTKLFEIVQLLK